MAYPEPRAHDAHGAARRPADKLRIMRWMWLAFILAVVAIIALAYGLV